MVPARHETIVLQNFAASLPCWIMLLIVVVLIAIRVEAAVGPGHRSHYVNHAWN